jgi:RNA polymerase sigma-70 factor (ECF subfamily)
VQPPEGVDVDDLVSAEPSRAESVETMVTRKDLSRRVANAMLVLPEEQRSAILLKEYHGLTFHEIAELQGCPLSTVKTRLYQGLSVLRRELERRGQGPVRPESSGQP